MTDDDPNTIRIPVPEALAHATLPGWNSPVLPGFAFVAALCEYPMRPREQILTLTTPESRATWGDFTDAAHMVLGTGVATSVRPSSDPDVCYLKLHLLPAGSSYYVQGDDMSGTFLTLVWRPERGMWLIHQLGPPADPVSVPH